MYFSKLVSFTDSIISKKYEILMIIPPSQLPLQRRFEGSDKKQILDFFSEK